VRNGVPSLVLASALLGSCTPGPVPAAGLFEVDGEIGETRRAGFLQVDPTGHAYILAGGGENVWGVRDAFHGAWTRVSGDVTLAADVTFPAPGGNAHRKAFLMVRQNLQPDSPYADAVLHGNGLASLQYRELPGARTYEIQSAVSAPRRLRIEKRGKYVSMSLSEKGEPLHPAGGSFRLMLEDPFYVGLGVSAHDNAVLEKAAFSDVSLQAGAGIPANAPPLTRCTLETVPIASKDRRVVYTTNDRIEAPNWSRDGTTLIFSSKGRLHRIPVQGGLPQAIDTGIAVRCNNDHGLSPDGRMMAISDQSEERRSLIYILPAAGGPPRRVTTLGPSYWHGWSPDGKTLAYCGERGGEFDIYTIPVEGGPETRLTTAKGLDDGPDYTPDGRFIYFNSERTGTMQIWRMRPDGRDQEQVTSDEFNNWFPHPSPDGQWLVFLSYEGNVKGHPENKDVTLRIMPLSGGPIGVLAKLLGGQGTINVPSWSPDSKKVAFVSCQIDP
jgi:TolB protein